MKKEEKEEEEYQDFIIMKIKFCYEKIEEKWKNEGKKSKLYFRWERGNRGLRGVKNQNFIFV